MIDTDPSRPVEELPNYRCLVRYDEYHGIPEALAMNAEIFQELAGRAPTDQPIRLPSQAAMELIEFFRQYLPQATPDAKGKKKLVPAGKNAGGFDLPFLNNMHGIFADNQRQFLDYRVADPGPMFWNPSVDGWYMPGFRDCLERAGLQPTKLHRAYGDALDVIRLVRFRNAYLQPIEACSAA